MFTASLPSSSDKKEYFSSPDRESALFDTKYSKKEVPKEVCKE